MMKHKFLMTVAMMGLLGTTYGTGDDVIHGEALLPVPVASAAVHAALAAHPQIQPLIAGMNAYDQARAFNTLNGMDESPLNNFLDSVNSLVEGLAEYERSELIWHLVGLPSADCADVAKRLSGLLGVGMFSFDRQTVIKTIAAIPADERDDFIALLNPLIDGTERYGRARIIEALAEVPQASRVDVSVKSAALFGAGMDGIARMQVIQAISTIPDDQWEAFKLRLDDLIEGIDGEGREWVIQALAAVSHEDRENVTARSCELFGAVGIGVERFKIIETVASIPAEDRVAFVNAVNQSTEGFEGEDRTRIIEALATVPPADRDDVSKKSAALFGERMSGFYRGYVIQTVARIPAGERAAFVGDVNPLIAGTTDSTRKKMINAFANVPSAHRADVSVAAVAQGIGELDEWCREELIKQIAQIYAAAH